jgi:hypothetical protein
MIDFVPPMMSMTYDPRRETARFVWRNMAFAFAVFQPVEAQNEMAAAHSFEARPARALGREGLGGQRPGNRAASHWNSSKPTRKWRRRFALAGDEG